LDHRFNSGAADDELLQNCHVLGMLLSSTNDRSVMTDVMNIRDMHWFMFLADKSPDEQ
jgi:hypothetical protein